MFTIITATSVEYGDITPVTQLEDYSVFYNCCVNKRKRIVFIKIFNDNEFVFSVICPSLLFLTPDCLGFKLFVIHI